MAITNFSAYQRMRDQPTQKRRIARSNMVVNAAGRLSSGWTAGGDATGAAPTTAAVPTSATAGALGQQDSSNTQRIVGAVLDFNFGANLATGGMIIIADRLSHQGGQSGTATGAQTTNLPTAALTRYTSGVGVMAAMEVYTSIGTSGATATASYTNSSGSSGRTTETFSWGVSGFSTAGRFVVLPLQVGDVGVKSVESFTASGSSGTAGNFGVTLFYPLLCIPVTAPQSADNMEALLDFGMWAPPVVNGACLFLIGTAAATATGVVTGQINISEDA